mmetsp:Transcript_2478/g.6443  ORF Transcript_2478/g.6443 Transcript_2478/m.6443 type:complete len:277 (+) Transcript_2478:720-1550(+)
MDNHLDAASLRCLLDLPHVFSASELLVAAAAVKVHGEAAQQRGVGLLQELELPLVLLEARHVEQVRLLVVPVAAAQAGEQAALFAHGLEERVVRDDVVEAKDVLRHVEHAQVAHREVHLESPLLVPQLVQRVQRQEGLFLPRLECALGQIAQLGVVRAARGASPDHHNQITLANASCLDDGAVGSVGLLADGDIGVPAHPAADALPAIIPPVPPFARIPVYHRHLQKARKVFRYLPAPVVTLADTGQHTGEDHAFYRLPQRRQRVLLLPLLLRRRY